jgi:hypothetical protein
VKLSSLTLRILLLFLAVATVIGSLSASGARADTILTAVIYDQTTVYPWSGTGRNTSSPFNHWTDIVAHDPVNWDIKRVEISWLLNPGGDAHETITMQIYTNYPLYGGEAGTADVWLQNKNTGDVAGILLHNGSDKLVSGVTWASSRNTTIPNQWSTGNWIYAGEYAPQGADADPGALPLTSIWNYSNTLSTVSVGQANNPDPADSKYITTLVLPLNFLESEWTSFDFTVMSGTCANEVLAGIALAGTAVPAHAPLPPSVLLLASGLAGIGLLRLRRHRS